ncbi:MAG: acetate--CoA ligase [Candidatus Heimdallarchaeota archaeon]|nr:acetate--CoA ligase [Candidatus Heimdallarchaeota archaeon]
MSNIDSYDNVAKNFSWKQVEEELEYKEGDQINIAWYCTDRICNQGKGDKLALIWEGMGDKEATYTFNELRIATNTMGQYLRDNGIQMGDRVCLFMDKIPELFIGVLACLKIGAIAQPLFSAFGDESLFVRLDDAQTKAIITQRKHVSKVRKIIDKMPYMDHIIIVDHDGKKTLKEKEITMDLAALDPVDSFEIAETFAESPSLLHYTSGTTGKPKGVKHVHYSLISQYITAKWVLDLKQDDIYWCTADPGWVTGTSYGIIGPWANGITQCVMDVGFSAKNWYAFIAKHKITMWYSAPTAIRSLMKAGEEVVKEYNMNSLRHLASVGEPLNAEAVIWSEKVFGKPFYDTYWQTETGSMMICNYPGMKVKPGSMGKPFPGITGTVLNAQTFEPINEPGIIGLIGFKFDWPARLRTYWNNEDTFKKKFGKEWYLTGDKAKLDEDGYFWFVGRDDDVINTAGHLVSPFEIESALLEHESIAESAVVAKPDDINMEIPKAYITLKEGFDASEELELNIMNFIRKRLSPLAMPQEIEMVKALPKTRSGKIMRRLLHAREWGENLGDISTIENIDDIDYLN